MKSFSQRLQELCDRTPAGTRLSCAEIAAQTGVSRVHISRLERRATRKAATHLLACHQPLLREIFPGSLREGSWRFPVLPL